jgi:FkbM family methyltransferase
VRVPVAVRVLRALMRHPLGRLNRPRTVARFLRWQLGSRLLNNPVAMPFVGDARLLVSNGMQGATGNLYVGLLELEPMGFVLHTLRPDELLLDVGANVGVYTVLAAGGCGARVIAFEPVPGTADRLEANVRLNDLGERVEVRRRVVGSAVGFVEVTTDRDSTNRVLQGRGSTDDASERPTASVQVLRLDDVDVSGGRETPRFLIKVDVEGYEVEVLDGAEALLRRDELLAVIIEINGSGEAFGHPDELILERLERAGLTEVTYDPIRRELREQASPDQTRIFVRDVAEVRRRIENAPRVRLGIGVDI